MSALEAFCDGVSTVSTHNGVHRIVLFKLNPEGKPLPAVELMVPVGALSSITEALARLKRA